MHVSEDEEVDQLRRRLEETEKAMERICRQMGDVTDKLLPTAVAELFTPQLQEAEKVGIDKVALHSFIHSIAITSKIFTGKKSDHTSRKNAHLIQR